MKKASMGGRSFNRVSQMPVLKKVRIRDIIVIFPFYYDMLLKNSTNCHSRPFFRRGKVIPAKVASGSEGYFEKTGFLLSQE
jgi:hypothetical protein